MELGVDFEPDKSKGDWSAGVYPFDVAVVQVAQRTVVRAHECKSSRTRYATTDGQYDDERGSMSRLAQRGEGKGWLFDTGRRGRGSERAAYDLKVASVVVGSARRKVSVRRSAANVSRRGRSVQCSASTAYVCVVRNRRLHFFAHRCCDCLQMSRAARH